MPHHLVIMNGFSPDLSLEGGAQLIFPSGGLSGSSCASVTITDDGLFEGGEMYCLTLQSSDPDIIVGSTSFTCVVIADNNRKLWYSSFGVVITFPFDIFSSQNWLPAVRIHHY